MRETERERCSSCGREPDKQSGGEPSTTVQIVSRASSQTEGGMQSLWQTPEGVGVLQHALSAIQEVRRSVADKGQPVCPNPPRGGGESEACLRGRRLREALSRERLLLAARDATTKGQVEVANERTGVSSMQVRRLTPR